MAETVEVVVRIPKELYDYIQSETYDKHLDSRFDYKIRFAVKEGIQLPKGHKRLIEDNFEVGPVYNEEGNRVGYNYVTQYELDNALTIVPEDKEM